MTWSVSCSLYYQRNQRVSFSLYDQRTWFLFPTIAWNVLRLLSLAFCRQPLLVSLDFKLPFACCLFTFKTCALQLFLCGTQKHMLVNVNISLLSALLSDHLHLFLVVPVLCWSGTCPVVTLKNAYLSAVWLSHGILICHSIYKVMPTFLYFSTYFPSPPQTQSGIAY